MTDQAQTLYAVIRNIRLCFNLLRGWADVMHEDLGVNASMRAVMEALSEGAEKTVPEIARARGVSRQHIQVIANRLGGAGLIETRANPRDRRTVLMALSASGADLFEEIQARERVALERLAARFDKDALGVALAALGTLSGGLKEEHHTPGDGS
jgi:DNA-binding MarR family transcriptional regulator